MSSTSKNATEVASRTNAIVEATVGDEAVITKLVVPAENLSTYDMLT